MLRSSGLRLMMTQYCFANFTTFFYLPPLHRHVRKTCALNPADTGRYRMLPLLCGAVGNVLPGWLVDRI